MFLTVSLGTTMSQTDRLTGPAKYTQRSDKRIVVFKQRILKNMDSSSVRYFTYTKKVAYVIIGANGCVTRAWWGSSPREDEGKIRRAVSIIRGFKLNASSS